MASDLPAYNRTRPHGLAVRTPAFHAGNRRFESGWGVLVSVAHELAAWAAAFAPDDADRRLADRALVDTVAVSIAAREAPLLSIARSLGTAGQLAVAAHLLDYDDLHLPSTSHISAVCVPAAVAAGGDARAYLAAAGVMARLGRRLGWAHYDGRLACHLHGRRSGGRDRRRGRDRPGRRRPGPGRSRLAIPAAGGNHRAFGTHAKALQVGFAVDAGVRAAALAKAGASVDLETVDVWLALVGATPGPLERGSGTSAPPCPAAWRSSCILAATRCSGRSPPSAPRSSSPNRSRCQRSPRSRSRPRKARCDRCSTIVRARGWRRSSVSLYAAVATLLDDSPGLASFTDQAVARAAGPGSCWAPSLHG